MTHIRNIRDWLVGAYFTWRLKRDHPDLYKRLCALVDEGFDPDDYVEVDRPGGTVYVHKDSAEALRKRGEENQE